MSAATATNRVTPPVHSHSLQLPGIAANASIPVGRMEQWRREAIQKVIAFGGLAPNWDSHGSQAPSMAVRQTALDLLYSVPGELFAAPRIVPVSGSGLHFEWSADHRELEISIESDCRVEALQVENGVPKEGGPFKTLPELFDWLASR